MSTAVVSVAAGSMESMETSSLPEVGLFLFPLAVIACVLIADVVIARATGRSDWRGPAWRPPWLLVVGILIFIFVYGVMFG